MNNKKITFSDVRYAAQGQWRAILPGLGIHLISDTSKHTPCPGCGGKDRFRFIDKDGLGTWYCSGGGNPCSGDGFNLVGHVTGMTNGQVLKAVAGQLGLSSDMPEKQLQAIQSAAEERRRLIEDKIRRKTERNRLDSNVKNLTCELEGVILEREYDARQLNDVLSPSGLEKEIASDLMKGLKASYQE